MVAPPEAYSVCGLSLRVSVSSVALAGVFALSPGHWIVLLGPYLLLLALRGCRLLLKM